MSVLGRVCVLLRLIYVMLKSLRADSVVYKNWPNAFTQ